MELEQAAKLFEALSFSTRLNIFRLLVKHAPNGLVAGDIAKRLKLPPTNLSFHLKALLHAGLVSMEQEGRFVRYKARIQLMEELVAYLTEECCTGSEEECSPSCTPGEIS